MSSSSGYRTPTHPSGEKSSDKVDNSRYTKALEITFCDQRDQPIIVCKWDRSGVVEAYGSTAPFWEELPHGLRVYAYVGLSSVSGWQPKKKTQVLTFPWHTIKQYRYSGGS